MILIQVIDRIAYIHAGEWHSDDMQLEARLNELYTNKPEGPSPSDPDPDGSLAEQAVAGELAASIIHRDPLEDDEDDSEVIF